MGGVPGMMLRRLRTALLAAAVLSLAAALLVAAWRTPEVTDASPSTPLGSAPSTSPSPRVALPDATFLVQTEDGYRPFDLSAGEIGPRIGLDAGSDHLFGLPDGRLLCVCTDHQLTGGQETAAVDVRWLSRTGKTLDEFRIGVHAGDYDPDMPMGAVVEATFDPTSEVIYLSRLQREGEIWRLAIDVVSLAARGVVQTVELDPVSTVPGANPDSPEPVYAWPPSVEVANDGRHLVLRQTSVHRGATETRFWSASLKGGLIGPLSAWPTGEGTASECGTGWSGFATGASYFAICGAWSGDRAWLRHVDLSGKLLADVELGVPVSSVLVDHEREALFTWDPFAKAMARVDLASGELLTAHAGGPFEQVASWMVPAARAKVMLEPALMLSPDGSRLYAAALEPGEVWVFEAKTLERLDRWAVSGMPTSIALTTDGSLLFVAATILHADGEAGEASPRGSMVAYETPDGAALLRADDLAFWMVTLAPDLMPAMP
jgi:hypothetical protein